MEATILLEEPQTPPDSCGRIFFHMFLLIVLCSDSHEMQEKKMSGAELRT